MPRDSIYVVFRFGINAGDAARRMLRDCGLHAEAADSEARDRRGSGMHSSIHLNLSPDDPRLPRLLQRLRDHNVFSATYFNRVYSKRELDRATWLWLNVGTCGVPGGGMVGQPYNSDAACVACGAGITPEPPLIAHLSRISPKGLDHVAYDGHVIVSAEVAAALTQGGVSGFVPRGVRSPKSWPSTKYVWLQIASLFPRMSDLSSGLVADKRCQQCSRAGYWISHAAPFVPCFEQLPRDAPDLNLTWEYFGEIEHHKVPRPLPGRQLVIASQRVRQVLLDAGLRRLRWTPIATVTSASGPTATPATT